MNDNQDRLMDLAIEEAARKNGPPDLRAKIMAAASNKATPRITGKLIALPQRRMRVLPIAITAIAALIVLTVLVNIDFVREIVTRANSGTGATSAGLEPKKQPATNQATEEPKPIRAPSVSDPSNNSGQDGSAVPPANEPPKEQPKSDQPKPEEPRKPDEVKKSEEKPPEERKPDGEVEKPKQPEETQPKETPRKDPVVIASVIGKPKLKLRYADTETWSDFEGATLKSGVQLQARGYVDLSLTSGALLRFDGQLSFLGDAKSLDIKLQDKSVYVDNARCGQIVKVSARGLDASLEDGAALFIEHASALEIACFDGEVATAFRPVRSGFRAELSSRSLEGMKRPGMERIFADLPARVVLREDFEKEPAGGMYGGKISEGIAAAKGHGEYVAFRFNPTLRLLPRMAVRFSVRYSKAKRLQLEMFEQGNDQPWLIHLTPEQGDWVTVTVKFDELRLREKPDARLSADTLLRNFKLYVEGEKDASLEIDWVEFVRLGPGE